MAGLTAKTLSLDVSSCGFPAATSVLIVLRRATSADSFSVIPTDFKITIDLLTDITTKLIASTYGSVYEISLFDQNRKVLSRFFIEMPDADALLSGLVKLTSWPSDGRPITLSELNLRIATEEQARQQHQSNLNNPHQVTAAQLGLGNVNNTSDINKPVSTPTQNAINTAISSAVTPSERVTALAPFSGAQTRTQRDKNAESVSVKDFGAVGDGTYHPLSERFATLADAQFAYPNAGITALTQSIDWAATQQAVVSCALKSLYVPAGGYVLTDPVRIMSRINIFGDGFDADVNTGRTEAYRLNGSYFISIGTGAKVFTCRGSSSCRSSGGVISNAAEVAARTAAARPDAGFTLDSEFSLASYHNNDATSTAAATPKMLSAAFYIGYGVAGCVFRDFRIHLGFGGASIAGYINKTLTLADDWDIGLYMDNARYNHIENVQVLGYWRMNGLLIRSGAHGNEEAIYGKYSGAEENKFYNCVFQGWKSVGCRSIDMHKVTAVTSTYIEIPWAADHPFDLSLGNIRSGEFSSRSIGVSSMSKQGDFLRFNTTSSQVGFVAVGATLSPSFIGNGVAGTVFEHCRMHGMSHTSNRRVSDPAITGAMPPSACLEVSGTRIRGIRIEGSKLQTVDDIGLHLHQCIDFYIANGRFEGSSSAVGGAGIRMLTTPRSSDITNYPHVVRPTFRVHLQGIEQPACDFTPVFGSVPAKFLTTGFWRPDFHGATYAQGGIFVGGGDSFNYLSEFSQSVFTPAVSLENNGDLEVQTVYRTGSQTIIGERLLLTIAISVKLTWTTASGELRVSIPRLSSKQTNLSQSLSCSFEGVNLPAGYTHINAVIEPDTQYMRFVASGSNQPRLVLTTAHLVSGAFVIMSINGTYVAHSELP